MKLTPSVIIVSCTFAQLLGLTIFIKGFLPIKRASPGYASHSDAPPEPSLAPTDDSNINETRPIPPIFGRLILMLIDALRWDFVLGSDNERMPFTRTLIDQGRTLSFVAKAHPPTVTMPRVKALTSGTIPGFVDVILNMDTTALVEDNIIHQLKAAGKNIFFFGDDTWIRLFPDVFVESDGTTSFFVSDYTEVDDNVSRHLEPTLARSDWDVLILHYLGLDHIGHIGGPASPLVKPKLIEMDQIIAKIHKSIAKADQRRSLASLIVVCGDHGMSESGSHGGASLSEILTPLILISPRFRAGKGSSFPYNEVQQIDMSPTLSLLLGLPIPQSNLGIIIPQVLQLLPMRQQLRALQLNSHQLVQIMKQNFIADDCEHILLNYHHVIQAHASWLHEYSDDPLLIAAVDVGDKVIVQYLRILKTMQAKITANITKYDVHAMISGIVICFQVAFLLIYSTISSFGHQIAIDTSPLKILPLLCACCLVTLTLHVTLCTSDSIDTSDMLCGQSPASNILYSAAFTVVVAVSMSILLSVMSQPKLALEQIVTSVRSMSATAHFLLYGSMITIISLLSSSFVEEEHQVWYFLTTTLLVGMLVQFVIQWISHHESSGVKAVTCALVICRLLRSWNQTGIKWADLPDIGDWLVRPENITMLSLVHSLSLVMLYYTLSPSRYCPITFVILLVINLYRHAVGNVHFPITLPTSHKGIIEAQIVYGLLVAKFTCATIEHFVPNIQQNILKLFGSKKNVRISEERLINACYEIFILLATLLLRPHNTAVVVMVVMLQRFFMDVCLPKLSLQSWSFTVVCLWMGQAAFYNQGNSNSIASVDLSSGYVGLDSHDPVTVGMLLITATNFGPISWMLSLLVKVTKNNGIFPVTMSHVCLALMPLQAIRLAVYTVVVTSQRYHLFIWSVFSPKLLYEAMHTLVLAIFVLTSFLFHLVDIYGKMYIFRNNMKTD